MNIRWLRIIGAAIVAEMIPIVLLIGVVAIFGPRDAGGAQEYASALGAWMGPIAGAVATFLLALWVAGPLPTGQIVHGVLLGLLVAFLDAALLVAGASEFRWLFVLSGLGRVVAGMLGGYVASKRTKPG